MKISKTICTTLSSCLILTAASAQTHVIGWQTFENKTAGNNNSGIKDNSPDTNSTYDATPRGSSSGNHYLTGAIGADASNSGFGGMGQSTDKSFLNGNTFGDELTITDYTLADGSPGERIGPNGGSGASSWKFSQQNNASQLKGDFSVTNHSDYHFKLEKIHFDARSLANATSPTTLEVRYLASPGKLVSVSSGTEVMDQKMFYANTWSEKGVVNVSQSIAAKINSAARIPPGEKATFRFIWSNASGNGQAQIDNLAFSGVFQDPNNNYAEIDPVTIGEKNNILISNVSRSGDSFSATFTTDNGNVDVYKSTDLAGFGDSPINSGVAPGTGVELDSAATETKAFYILVPEGEPAPSQESSISSTQLMMRCSNASAWSP